MPAQVPIQDIARKLRRCAEELEREVAKHTHVQLTPAEADDAEHRRAAMQRWGTRAGELLDEAFGAGALEWGYYNALKQDERALAKGVDDWHYRLFLATTSNIAESDPETGGVRVPGFLCGQCADWGNCHVTPNRAGSAECGEAIRKVAMLIEGDV